MKRRCQFQWHRLRKWVRDGWRWAWPQPQRRPQLQQEAKQVREQQRRANPPCLPHQGIRAEGRHHVHRVQCVHRLAQECWGFHVRLRHSRWIPPCHVWATPAPKSQSTQARNAKHAGSDAVRRRQTGCSLRIDGRQAAVHAESLEWQCTRPSHCKGRAKWLFNNTGTCFAWAARFIPS